MAPRHSYYSSSLDALRNSSALINFTHPDYQYYKPEWDLIRDALAGERRVKDQGAIYLPPLGANAGTTYTEYKGRATYVNMTARTLHGMVGSAFRRKVKVLGDDAISPLFSAPVTPEGLDFNLFAKTATEEVFTTGRVGILVDLDANGVNKPYFCHYMAENILSWRTEVIDGREVLTYVLLREVVDNLSYLGSDNNPASPAVVVDPVPAKKGSTNKRTKHQVSNTLLGNLGGARPVLVANYRVLQLAGGVYRQQIYQLTSHNNVDTLATSPEQTIIPLHNGEPLSYIPFVIIGTRSPSAKVQKSPLIDIANLNMAHYRTSAQLEHGRYFTALPVYYVQVSNSNEGGEYTVGPSVVWEVSAGEKPGILEFFGSGLASLATSLKEKEGHISQLGGRLMGISEAQGSQSDTVFQLQQANEVSILLSVTDSVSAGLTRAANWWLAWQNIEPKAPITVQINQDFKNFNIGAREMRAIASLYQSGIIPVQDLHRVLQESELIADDVSVEQFVEMLNDLKNFPGQPDVEAMHEGFPSAQGRLQAELAGQQVTSDEVIATDGNETMLELTAAKIKADEKAAKKDRDHAKVIAKRKATATPSRPVQGNLNIPKGVPENVE